MGGAETMVVNVLENLDRRKVTFDFVIPGAEEGLLEPRVIRLGAKVYHMPKRSESFWKSHRVFYRVVRDGSYRTVHLHTQNAFFTALHVWLARRAGAETIIVHSHNTMDWRGGLTLRLHKACRGWLYRHTDVRLACGKEAAEWLFGTTEGVEVLPLPVCCDAFRFDEAKREIIRAEMGLSGKTIYLHVGRFMDVKNHVFLIRVFEEIHRRKPESALLLVGDGALRADAEKQGSRRRTDGLRVLHGEHCRRGGQDDRRRRDDFSIEIRGISDRAAGSAGRRAGRLRFRQHHIGNCADPGGFTGLRWQTAKRRGRRRFWARPARRIAKRITPWCAGNTTFPSWRSG